MIEGPVQVAGLSVERDRLIQQLIIRCPLHLDRDMIPCIAVGIARDPRRDPFRILVVPDIPLISARNTGIHARR